MDLLVKEYLKTHSFGRLEEEHGVCARPNARGDKFSLNYDQILVKNGDPVAEQCRGLVIRPTQFDIHIFGDNWKFATVGNVDVLAWPMNRFYNHGDSAAAEVDWSDPDLRVYEKLDGTMMVVYWDQMHGRWHAGTRSVPEADLPIRKDHLEIGDMTFSELFFQTLRKTREALTGHSITWDVTGFEHVVHLNKELTYVFELTTPYNRIVVKYDDPRVTLIAARHTASGKEVPIESLRLEHVQRPKTWDLRNAAAIDAFVNSADPALLEGAVVCDSKFRRLKVKNKAWVLSSKAKDMVGSSWRSALEAILLNKIDDVIPLVEKDVAAELQRMQLAVKDYFHQIDVNFADWHGQAQGDRKSFAFLVQQSGDWTPAYFNLWERRSRSALEWVTKMCADGKLSAKTLDVILAKIGH